ncbi:uncharacterized protein LOC144284174 [Canis aureus]
MGGVKPQPPSLGASTGRFLQQSCTALVCGALGCPPPLPPRAPPLPPCAPTAERFTSRAPPATGTRVLLLHLPGPPHLVGSPAGASTCRGGQLGANALLFLSVNTYGVFVRVLAERSQSKAFLQARSYTEDRLRLEDENEKQERLLMSLLPRYVAMEMKEDFLKPPERIFHKIYIQRHDNVRSDQSHGVLAEC